MTIDKKKYGSSIFCIDLSSYFNWPSGKITDNFFTDIKDRINKVPKGRQKFWGIDFKLAEEKSKYAILANAKTTASQIVLDRKADYLCFVHQWEQTEEEVNLVPQEGLAVGEYRLKYNDGDTHTQLIRARFEVGISFNESPGPAWLAFPYNMHASLDPAALSGDKYWGWMQQGVQMSKGDYLVYAMPNPHPDKKIVSLEIVGLKKSPIIILGITLYNGTSHPLRHLPRRAYSVEIPKDEYEIESVEVDLGLVTRIERTSAIRDDNWLKKPGTNEETGKEKKVLYLVGLDDAAVTVKLNKDGSREKHKFSLGEAYHNGKSISGNISLNILDKKKQWMHISVIDSSTGKPTPVRIHISGQKGNYIAPYGHHEQINTNWFEDYGADVSVGGRNFAYVPETFTTDLPVGDIYVEISKGFEYKTVRQKITIKPGQKELKLSIDRWIDLRAKDWVTADTHVHFISPNTAWLEGQAEGVNVVNLLATQLGRLFTNVGDYTGRIGIVEDDTIVYVGTENRNHILGHISMLGTQGLPVYPMCCGGPQEAYFGDPDFMMLADWALENRRKGGLVIRPHYPYCGHTEDPVPIIKGLFDALEINVSTDGDFPLQEWYRYLNCGYRVAVCGGTDKMGAYTDLGWLRTYALLDKESPFSYDNWTEAVRSGRTISTTGPLLDLYVDGKTIGDTIHTGSGGGTVEIHAIAKSFWPLKNLEIIYNGDTVASTDSLKAQSILEIKEKIKIEKSGWLAARCQAGAVLKFGSTSFFDDNVKKLDEMRCAHTSPVYIKCGDTRAFNGPAAQHMLALVEGGVEYLKTIATVFDESSQKRMVKQFKEVQQELKIRLVRESNHSHHHGNGLYHTHGHGMDLGHNH